MHAVMTIDHFHHLCCRVIYHSVRRMLKPSNDSAIINVYKHDISNCRQKLHEPQNGWSHHVLLVILSRGAQYGNPGADVNNRYLTGHIGQCRCRYLLVLHYSTNANWNQVTIFMEDIYEHRHQLQKVKKQKPAPTPAFQIKVNTPG